MNEPDLIGTTLGRYRILERIGAGGMGEVYRARDETLRRDVALKVLPPAASADAGRHSRFVQEARATSALNHPNILAIHDHGVHEGIHYTVAELLEGATLRDVMDGRALPTHKAVEYALQIARGLAAAHEKGIVHRDLKPENLFVTTDGFVKILDFGIAKLVQPEETSEIGTQTSLPTQTEAGVVLGTTGYMSPEQIRGEAVDQRTDLFALGAVLYEMLAGRRAFVGATPADRLGAILNQEPPALAQRAIGADLDRVVRRCLAKNPRDRFQTALDLASELERPVGTSQGHKLRWAPVAAAVLGGLTVVAAVTLGVAWSRGWRPWFLAHEPVVAVLPVRNASEDPRETAYLGEAFGEPLLTRLGQVSRVRLVPWMTTQRFRGSDMKLDEVARELRADRLVVGSYRSDGEVVRVNVSLVDGRTGLQTWSQTYEERVEDVLSLQHSVALGIASHLRGDLSEAERKRLAVGASDNPVAYEYFLRGANFLSSLDPEKVSLAGPLFQKALELDPGLAEAWVGIGAVNADLQFRGLGGMDHLGTAAEAFQRALDLDPDLYSAWRGMIRVYYELGRLEDGLRIASRLRHRTDDPEALLCLGEGYTLCGLPELGIPVLERVIRLDPANQAPAWFLPIADAWAGEHDRLDRDAAAYTSRFGEDPEIYTWLALGRYARGRPLEARQFITRALDLFGSEQSNLYSVIFAHLLYRNLGENQRADSLANHWLVTLDSRHQAHTDNGRVRVYRATLAASVGRADGDSLVEEVFREAQHDRTLQVVIPEVLFAFGDPARLQEALRSRLQSELGFDHIVIQAGLMRLQFGARYSEIERLPEFQAYLTAALRRHDALRAAL